MTGCSSFQPTDNSEPEFKIQQYNIAILFKIWSIIQYKFHPKTYDTKSQGAVEITL
jgi:hypothetical protein